MAVGVPLTSGLASREARCAGGEGAGPRGERPLSWVVLVAPQRRRERRRGASLHTGAAAGASRRSPVLCAATTSSGQSQSWAAKAWHGRSNNAKHARSFVQNDGLCYLRSFFDPWTFNEIRDETTALRPFLRREKNGTAVDRMGMYMKPDSACTRAFSDPDVGARLSAIVGENAYLSEYPLEYRLYPRNSYMDWHKDETLFVRPQYELVFTLTNTSDSLTEWIDANGVARREWTEPNSLLLIRADAVLHRVLPVKRGERSILKIVYTPTEERLPSFLTHLATTYL